MFSDMNIGISVLAKAVGEMFCCFLYISRYNPNITVLIHSDDFIFSFLQ